MRVYLKYKLCCKCCCGVKRNDETELYWERLKRSKKQAEADFDILNIIKKLRFLKAQLKALLTDSERTMARKLSEKAIME